MKVKLRDVSNIIMGQSPDSSTYNTEKIGLPFFQGNADFGELNPIAKTWCSAPIKIAYKNYILISVRAPIGALNIAAETCCIGRGLAAFDVNNKMCTQKYLWYLLKAKKNELLSKGTGSTFKAISKNILSEMEFNIPPVREQELCTKVLDVVFCLIRLKKEQLDKLDLLVKSRFVEMFGDPKSNPKGWNKKTLSEIITKANNGMARRGNDESGSIVLRLVELQGGFIDYSKPNRIILTEKEQEKYLLQENDILFARVNGNPLNVGRCAVFHTIDEAVYHNDHIIRVHFDDSLINGVFASNILNSEYGKDQLKNKIKTSAGQYTISQDGIGAIESIMPPIELQNQFADFAEQVDKSKLAIQQSLDELETLKKSLMQQYFG